MAALEPILILSLQDKSKLWANFSQPLYYLFAKSQVLMTGSFEDNLAGPDNKNRVVPSSNLVG